MLGLMYSDQQGLWKRDEEEFAGRVEWVAKSI